MKKQILTLAHKFAAACAAVAIACTGLALTMVPTTAKAATTQDVLGQIEKAETKETRDLLMVMGRIENGVLTGYSTYVSKSSVDYMHLSGDTPNFDLSQNGYTVDLADKNYRLGMGSELRFIGYYAKAKVGYKLVGYTDVHYADQMLSADNSTAPSMELPTGSYKIDSVTYSKDQIVVNLQPVITDAYRAVQDAINDIGEVAYTQECRDRIDAAFAGYEALPEWEKPMVGNLDVLYAANRAYFNLKVAANS